MSTAELTAQTPSLEENYKVEQIVQRGTEVREGLGEPGLYDRVDGAIGRMGYGVLARVSSALEHSGVVFKSASSERIGSLIKTTASTAVLATSVVGTELISVAPAAAKRTPKAFSARFVNNCKDVAFNSSGIVQYNFGNQPGELNLSLKINPLSSKSLPCGKAFIRSESITLQAENDSRTGYVDASTTKTFRGNGATVLSSIPVAEKPSANLNTCLPDGDARLLRVLQKIKLLSRKKGEESYFVEQSSMYNIMPPGLSCPSNQRDIKLYAQFYKEGKFKTVHARRHNGKRKHR